MLRRAADYTSVYDGFHWRIPERYNIAVDVCDRHALVDPSRLALIYEDADGSSQRYSFGDMTRSSNRLANALRALGIGRGDRVAILLPQCPETAIAHLAIYKLGAIALPLFMLFGPEALEFRLADSGAKAIIVGAAGFGALAEIRSRLADLAHVIVVGAKAPNAHPFQHLLDRASDRFDPIDTAADDPALIIYTSGTTGPPKGALHAHRVLLGHLPGVEFPHEFFPQAGDLFWTPADWAWIGGLLDVLLPSWHHGVPVLAHRASKFDPEHALDLMARHGVRNVFMPPTALKLMRQSEAKPRHDLRLRTVASGGERLGEELIEWSRRTFALTVNEFYGQTEANLVVGNCSSILPVRAGSMGRAMPGHVVEVVDETGRPQPPDATGVIAVKAPDPTMFLRYWNQPEATQQKFVGPWCLTGDTGRKDKDGYFWFEGRNDDVINSAGYRIGPAEIEECLMRHPAVAMVAVIGWPDALRGEVVKAFVVPRHGHAPSSELAREIQTFVKQRLAQHEYPRLVEFRDSLPMTVTGKIRRRDLRPASAGKAD
ncbi:MAG: acyl-CoA synthetase [Proteobacteria bacterium]|nr:acyl-CoA synthetase [Pseudomonadota bacterium]